MLLHAFLDIVRLLYPMFSYWIIKIIPVCKLPASLFSRGCKIVTVTNLLSIIGEDLQGNDLFYNFFYKDVFVSTGSSDWKLQVHLYKPWKKNLTRAMKKSTAQLDSKP